MTTDAPPEAPEPTVTRLPYQGRVIAGGRKRIRLTRAARQQMRRRGRIKAAPEEPLGSDPFAPARRTSWAPAPRDHPVKETEPEPSTDDADPDTVTLAQVFADGHGHSTFDAAKKGRGHGMTRGNVSEIALAGVPAWKVDQFVARRLGYTRPQIAAAYRVTGRPGREAKAVRDHVDAGLAALQERGANMTDVARVLGWDVERRADGTSRCQWMQRALARGRK
jgi:hypothetical protein